MEREERILRREDIKPSSDSHRKRREDSSLWLEVIGTAEV